MVYIEKEHPIQFLRAELMDLLERMQRIGFDEEKLRTSIDLSCENILEHFNLEKETK